MSPDGQLSVGKVTTRNGVSVIPLNDSTGGTLYVAAKGPPYMISLVGGSGDESVDLTFSEHGTAKVPPEPTGALDIDELQNSESLVTDQVVHREATATHNAVSAALP